MCLRKSRIKVTRTFVVLGIALVSAGCGSMINSVAKGNLKLYQVSPAFISPSATKPSNADNSGKTSCDVDKLTNPDGTDKPIDLRCFKIWICSSQNADDCKATHAYSAAIADSSGVTRNRLKSLLTKNSDRICSQSQAQLVGANDMINFSFAEITTILAGSGALVGSLTTAKILSGTAAITNSTRTQVNEVFYQNALKSAIIQRETSLRVTQLQSIDSRSYLAPSADKQQLLGLQDAQSPGTKAIAQKGTGQKNGASTAVSGNTSGAELQTDANSQMAGAQPPNQEKSTADSRNQVAGSQSVASGPNPESVANSSATNRVPASLASYSTEEMLNDVEDYHNMCSFFAGVTGLTQTTTTYTPQDVNALIKAVKDTANGTGVGSNGGGKSAGVDTSNKN